MRKQSLLFVRLVCLLLVATFSLAVMLIAIDRTDSQNAGIVIGSCASIGLLAIKGILDYDDSGE